MVPVEIFVAWNEAMMLLGYISMYYKSKAQTQASQNPKATIVIATNCPADAGSSLNA